MRLFSISIPFTAHLIFFVFCYFTFDLSFSVEVLIIILILLIFMWVGWFLKPPVVVLSNMHPIIYFYGFLVFLSNIIEFTLLGVPLINENVSYHDFGFAYLHHISVSSWIFVFLAFSSRQRVKKIVLFSLAIIFPLLYQNRDVLVLTLYCILIISVAKGYIKSPVKIFFIGLAGLLFFGFLGEIRSPGQLAIALNHMPFRNWVSDLPNVLLWPLIYMSSPIFNSVNFIYGADEIVYENINAVSEFMRGYNLFGLVGVLFYFFFVFLILLVSQTVVRFSSIYLPFYVFISYQCLMGTFSRKVFISHTLYGFLAFIVLLFAARYYDSITRRLKKE